MTSNEIAKTIRKNYKFVLEDSKYWETQRRKHPRRFTKEYYYASGAEWAWHDVANLLGIELYDENFNLIEDKE